MSKRPPNPTFDQSRVLAVKMLHQTHGKSQAEVLGAVLLIIAAWAHEGLDMEAFVDAVKNLDPLLPPKKG